MKLRPLSAAVVLALLAIYPFQATEQYRPRILRSLNRSASFHLSQSAVFTFDLLQAVGGVLSQTNALLTDTGAAGTFSLTVDLDSGEYPGYITVRHIETRAPYSIAYSDLVPMALFVDSDATGLYTLWSEQRLPDRFLHNAGFVQHDIRGHVALEFDATRYSDALYFIDLCDECLGYQQIPVDVSLEKQLSKSAAGRPGSSYLNTDVTLPFGFSVVDGRADVSGGIARFRWRTRPQVEITVRPLLPGPDSTIQSLLQASEHLELLTDLDEDVVQPLMDAAESVDAATSRSLDAGFFLFETLALLRTAKTDAPEEWSAFMRLLTSDPLVSADPLPWDRYTQSVCAAYPDTAECLN